MKSPVQKFPLTCLSLAVIAVLSVHVPVYSQEQDEEQVLDEVVTTGTRLKGTATAVLQERKNQAFVADILGAEQISRTGDSDAASALRRVTGLTLVDGKFIYVRGLGERYSSTQLNGAAVPSPDPSRSVIPLDLFPSDIIESLSVQKSFSPSMPAAFGGGNVDIRLKTIPSESPECVGCHTTGYGLGGFDIKDAAFYAPAEDDKDGQKAAKLMEKLKNVGCEACHGPGSKYKSKKTMEAIYTGTEKSETYGLVIPTEETCKQCHNEKSPMFKEFKFDEAYAKIAHNIPEVEPSK